MPDLIDIVPKDLHAVISIPVSELKKLKIAMNLTHVDFDGTNKEEAEAAEYFSTKFYSFVDSILEEVKNGP